MIVIKCNRKIDEIDISITDKPDNSKYVEKIVSTISNHVKRKDTNECAVAYKNNRYTKSDSEGEQSLDYEEVFDHNFNVTNDSGITSKYSTLVKDDTSIEDDTPVKPHTKKIQFSPEVSTVVEVEIQKTQKQPAYCYSTPYKYVTRISETPKPQKVEYEYVTTSKVKEATKELLNREVLDAVNVIREVKEPQQPVDLSEINISNSKNFVRSSSCRTYDEKFVVNLFESRQSKRWKRRSICVANLQSSVMKKPLNVTHGSHVENRRTTCSEREGKQTELDDNAMFQKLKRERDAECVKMNQASNILHAIRKKTRRDWTEELLAERILLETDEKCKLIVNKIRELNYSEVRPQRSNHVATITLSKFQYLLKAQDRKAHKYSEFFVLTLSHGTDFAMSRVTTPTNNNLEFSESFTFKNVDSNFNIKAKLFSVRLKTRARITSTLLKRKARNLCPMSKIYYENVHTYEMAESRVLKTSFAQCGETNITKDDIGNTSLLVSNIPEESRLHSGASFSLKMDDLEMNSKVSGFLTLGIPNKQNDILFWERKWCVLDKTQFSIYNYPSDEDFGEPVTTINLEYCFVPFLTNVNNCSKKRNFLLKTGRPSLVNESNNVTLRKRPNFVLEKYFFSADNNEDFSLWTSKLNSTLTCLKDWRKLVFIDDYY